MGALDRVLLRCMPTASSQNSPRIGKRFASYVVDGGWIKTWYEHMLERILQWLLAPLEARADD